MRGLNSSQDPEYYGPVGYEKKLHKDHFGGVDTSHFKVWVVKRGKLVRVTKAQAHKRGYKIVSTSRNRPDIRNANAAQGAEVTSDNPI